MPAPIQVANNGDLFIVIGQGAKQKLVQVHKVILTEASPFFSKLLNGPWKESAQKNDVHNPLELPDDDADTAINLFKVLHFRSHDVSTTPKDWLQKLALMCDKYQCAERLRDFFTLRLDSAIGEGPDRVIIAALIGNKTLFELKCLPLVTTVKTQVQTLCHADLKNLLPHDLLDTMMAYRRKARQEYCQIIQGPIYDMHDAAKSNRLCVSFNKRHAAYTTLLMASKVLYKDVDVDAPLHNLHAVFTTKMLAENQTANEDLIEKCTSGRCLGCTWVATTSIRNAANKITKGKMDGSMTLCFECFKARKTAFKQTCKLHGPTAVTQGQA